MNPILSANGTRFHGALLTRRFATRFLSTDRYSNHAFPACFNGGIF